MKDQETKSGQPMLHQMGALAVLVALVALMGYTISALGNHGNTQMQTSLLAQYPMSDYSQYSCDELKTKMSYDQSAASEYENRCMDEDESDESDESSNDTQEDNNNEENNSMEQTNDSDDEELCEDGTTPVEGECTTMKEDEEKNEETNNETEKESDENTDDNTKEVQSSTGQKEDHCVPLRKKAASGDEAAQEEFEKYCAHRRDNYCLRLEEAKEKGNQKAATEYDESCVSTDEEKTPVAEFCPKLKTLLEGNYTEKDKAVFTRLCANSAPVENVCSKLKDAEDAAEDEQNETTDSPEFMKRLCTYQPSFRQGSGFCLELKQVMDKYSTETDSQDYSLAKQKFVAYCQKQVPPAGYEDEVIAEFDEEDNPFSDTETCSLKGRSAFELYRRAVIGGFEDGTFRGDNPVNRAEAAKFLLLARFGSVEDTENSGRFRDIAGKPWFIRYIMKAEKLGIIGGHPDGTFKPADGVTIAEFLKMLTRTFQLELNLPYSYSDVPADAWFAQYAGIAEKYNLFPKNLNECGDAEIQDSGLLDPSHKLTRYQVAVAIYQFLVNRGTEEVTDME